MTSKYKLSVIIPTLGREENLISALSDLAKQKLEKYKWECIIVTQNHFGDSFLNKIKHVGIANLKTFYLEEPNASLARNIGLKESKSEIILFLDDDIIIDSDVFLSAHLQNYKKNPELSGVFGQVLSTERIRREERHHLSMNFNYGWLYFPPNFNFACKIPTGGAGNLSVQKKFAIEVGGMDANYIKGAHREESDFCLRLTKKYGLMNFDPDSSLVHIGEPTGGVRSWGYNSAIHPMHHIVGEWYFILNGLFKYKTIRFIHLHHHVFQILWRQIFNKPNLKKVYPIFSSIIKSFIGFLKAIKLMFSKNRLYSNQMKYEEVK